MSYNGIMIKAFWVIVAVIAVIGVVGILNSQRTTVPQFRGEIYSCQATKECVKAIQPDTCCPCPKVINRMGIGSNGWIEYDQTATYPGSQARECHQIECKPCAESEKIVCENNQCGFEW